MLKIPFLLVLCCCCYVLTINNAAAQSNTDSLSDLKVAATYTRVQNNFNEAMGPQSGLYNGVSYDPYDPSITGNPYFMEATSYNPGSVVYDGYLYSNVDMYYDLNKDQVIIALYHSHLQMSLLNSKLTSFDLLGHHFININAAAAATVKSGYYDELYDGKVKVLARRTKAIQSEPVAGGRMLYYFIKPGTDYFLLRNGVYYPVNSQGDFIDVFKDKHTEIKQFIKTKKIKFRKDRERSMIDIAAYYDQLTE